jgi:predicted N-acetyltransferase YhbS
MEKRAYLHLLEESFPGMQATIARCEALGFPWSSRPFLKEEKGEIVSHVGFLNYPMLIEGKWRNGGALHAICTKASHRGRGLASALIQEVLEWAKTQVEFVILFTEIPKFYERLSFHSLQEYRFHLPCKRPKGSLPSFPMTCPKDAPLFLNCFHSRVPLSTHLWVKDQGAIASFNTLFATYPTFWSLHYSPSLEGILSYHLEGKTLHLYDVIAENIPSLDGILDHIPAEIEGVYFYFPPDRFTNEATPEPYLYDKGHFMVHEIDLSAQPFMIAPLSRC